MPNVECTGHAFAGVCLWIAGKICTGFLLRIENPGQRGSGGLQRQPILESGKALDQQQAIKVLRTETTQTVVAIGSGSYVFKISNL